MLLFFVSIVAIIFSSLVQTTELLSFYSVKPNLTLILIVILSSIYRGWAHRFSMLFLASIFLKFSEIIEIQDLIPFTIMLLSIVLLDYLPWNRLINVIISVLVGTIIFNLIVFIPLTLISEIIINAIFTITMFPLTQIIYAEKIRLQENRF